MIISGSVAVVRSYHWLRHVAEGLSRAACTQRTLGGSAAEIIMFLYQVYAVSLERALGR
jgi:hypothetical protein